MLSFRDSDQQCERALLSPNGKLLLAYSISLSDPTYMTVHVWELESGQHKSFATEVYSDWRFSANSRLLAVSVIMDKGESTERSAAEIWDVIAMKRVKLIEVPHEWRGAYALGFSPDSAALTIGGYKKFGIYSVETGEWLAQETHHSTGFLEDSELSGALSDVEFSPDGKLLLTAGNDNRVILWKIQR